MIGSYRKTIKLIAHDNIHAQKSSFILITPFILVKLYHIFDRFVVDNTINLITTGVMQSGGR